MIESVWDYPRPPRVEPCPRRIRVVLGGETIVDSARTQRVLETSHAPVYYVPLEDIAAGVLELSGGGTTFCEWKGVAAYYDVSAGGRTSERGAWTYHDPVPDFEVIRHFVAFYPALMEACYVDDELVAAQAGGFYGGWITSDVVGPFKGEPGS